MPGSHRKGGKRTGRRPAFGTRGGPGSSYRARASPHDITSAGSASGGTRYPRYQRVRTDDAFGGSGHASRKLKKAATAYDREMRVNTQSRATYSASKRVHERLPAAYRETRKAKTRTTRARTMANAARRRKAKTRTAAKRRR